MPLEGNLRNLGKIKECGKEMKGISKFCLRVF